MAYDTHDFEERYPDFAGYGYDFSDRPPGDASDADTARRVRRDLPDAERVVVIEALIADGERLVRDMDMVWKAFSKFTNRSFPDAKTARQWLEPLVAVWKAELARIQG